VLVFAIVVAPLWSATQWAAAQLGYPPQLGASWFLIFTFPIYYPGRHFE